MWRKWMILSVLAAVFVTSGWLLRQPCAELVKRERLQPDPQRYEVLKDDLERWRKELSLRYAQAKTRNERAAVEHDARTILEEMLPLMMHCWLGTPWDFHGTAASPGDGKIACGYFVSTVLRDAGFRIDRYRLAQQPSGNIIQTFLSRKDCGLVVGKDYREFATKLSASGEGVYLVGLDTHVAFIVVRSGDFRFIHSSGSRPWCVVEETKDEAQVLARSNWRMTGNLTANSHVIQLWLKGEKIAVKGA